MTGNVVFLGFAAAGAPQFSAAASAIAIAAFLAGSLAGGRLGAAINHRGRLLSVAAALKVVFVTSAAVLAALTASPLGTGEKYAITVLLAVAMGIQNATARRLAVPDAMTTVLTMTLTGIAADSPLGGGTNLRLGRRLTQVIMMCLGAFIGAGLVLHASDRGVALALGVAALELAGVSVFMYARSRGEEAWSRFA